MSGKSNEKIDFSSRELNKGKFKSIHRHRCSSKLATFLRFSFCLVRANGIKNLLKIRLDFILRSFHVGCSSQQPFQSFPIKPHNKYFMRQSWKKAFATFLMAIIEVSSRIGKVLYHCRGFPRRWVKAAIATWREDKHRACFSL